MSERFFHESVTEKIGDAYKKWDERACIFIDAPTGSGKTTFILETLLPYFCKKDKRILYLVNRRILKKQLEDKISDLSYEQQAVIKIGLYQEIEGVICEVQNRKSYKGDQEVTEDQGHSINQLEEFSKCDCVVCDECHYFLADSNYNTNTSMSFRWIQDKFQNKLSIFMSATCGNIQSYIEKNNLYNLETGYTFYYGLSKYEKPMEQRKRESYNNLLSMARGEGPLEPMLPDSYPKRNIMTYKITRSYDYIEADNICFVNNRDEVLNLVVEEGSKWLIFVDNIKYGEKLKKVIRKRLRALKKGIPSESIDKEVYMLSSGYKRDPEGNEQVDHIVEKNVPLARIFITTSVLDNGVNIEDIELRNVLLFADTETEFIQMLGRKRRDALPINLYSFKYDKNHFCKRKKQLEKRKEIADNYLKHIRNKIHDLQKENSWKDWSDNRNRICLNECEKKCVERLHIKLMQDLSDHYINYSDVSSVFTVYGGKWYLNRLSVQNIENLNMYYKRIIEKFEAEGEDAFIREQLCWLGKDDEAENIIKRSRSSKLQMALERITERIQETGMEWMEKEKWKSLKNVMGQDLMCVFQSLNEETLAEEDKGFEKTVYNAIYRTSTHLTPKHVGFLNKYCGFPFQLEESKREESGKKVPKYKFRNLEEIEEDKK